MHLGNLLPSKIEVRIFKGKSGVFIAELPEYDVSTEVDSLLEIDDLINDLIYVYFDVPKEYRKAIRYMSEELKKEIDLKSHLVFQKFISSEAERLFR
ncbi:hypothetical protein HYS91_06060 [Candidatus Daviesbacteria bacterium]|nr:hypothetical protein [Candidatus Daviesbacteria bacterium]